MAPADPVTVWAWMSVGAGVPGKMKSLSEGMFWKAEMGTPRSLDRTSLCFFWVSISHGISYLGVWEDVLGYGQRSLWLRMYSSRKRSHRQRRA
jgi:hypothetical protein